MGFAFHRRSGFLIENRRPRVKSPAGRPRVRHNLRGSEVVETWDAHCIDN